MMERALKAGHILPWAVPGSESYHILPWTFPKSELYITMDCSLKWVMSHLTVDIPLKWVILYHGLSLEVGHTLPWSGQRKWGILCTLEVCTCRLSCKHRLLKKVFYVCVCTHVECFIRRNISSPSQKCWQIFLRKIYVTGCVRKSSACSVFMYSYYHTLMYFRLKVPCRTSTGQPCEAPYGFKNHLSLDLDTSRFAVSIGFELLDR